MYPASDPRSTLVSATNGSKAPTPPDLLGMQYGLFYETEPQEKSPGLKTWYTRGQDLHRRLQRGGGRRGARAQEPAR